MRTFVGFGWIGRAAACSIGLALILAGGPRPASSAPEDVTAAPPPRLSETELAPLVAPIALYPDVLLDSLLPATTAPLEVIAASRYVTEKGGTVDAAPEGVEWSPAVVALLQYPEVLRWMADNAPWLERIGVAMATQSGDVLAAVQRYRARAKQLGVLRSDEHQSVLVEPVAADVGAPQGTTYIVIQPVQPTVLYVPAYDPYSLLDTSWRWGGQPFYSAWLPYYAGAYGPWASFRISWGWGGYGSIYAYDQPWWYGRWQSDSSYWGPYRPRVWQPTYRGDWTGVRRSSTDATYRPRDPVWTTSDTSTRRMRTTAVRPSSDPAVGITPRIRTGFTPTTTAPTGLPATRDVAPAPTLPSAPTSVPVVPRSRTVVPTPSLRPRVTPTDGRATEQFRRRGAMSLDPSVRTATPTTMPKPPTRVALTPRTTPTPATETRRVQPARPIFGQPPANVPANGRKARGWRDRGQQSLDGSGS